MYHRCGLRIIGVWYVCDGSVVSFQKTAGAAVASVVVFLKTVVVVVSICESQELSYF